MRRVALALSLLVIGGTASAAIFVQPPERAPPRATPAKIGSLAPLSAPEVLEARRSPVPLMRLPQPPAPVNIASLVPLTEPPADLSQIKPTARASAPNAANMSAKAIETNPHKAVRDLTSDGTCKGRSLTSIRVEPDGRVIVQCS